MQIQQDFKELLELLNYHRVKYIIVGGYALAYHGAPRYTGDIDIYIKPDNNNAKKIMKVLTDFGFGSLGLKEEDFEKNDQVIQLGVAPVRVDIITSISGVNWDDAIRGSIQGKYDDIPVNYLGKKELIKNKQTTGRKKDLADLEALGED